MEEGGVRHLDERNMDMRVRNAYEPMAEVAGGDAKCVGTCKVGGQERAVCALDIWIDSADEDWNYFYVFSVKGWVGYWI